MDREKQIIILREIARVVDSVFVAGNDKHKIIAAVQALHQMVTDIKEAKETECSSKKATTKAS